MTEAITPTNEAPAVETTEVAAAPVTDGLAAKSALGAAGAEEVPASEGEPAAAKPDTAEETPAEPVKYEGLKAPEGFAALDGDALEAATPLLNALGVKDSAGAQTAIDTFAKEVLPKIMERSAAAAQAAQVEQIVQIRKDWLDQSRADPEFGGVNFDQNMTVAAKAVDAFGGEPLRKLFDETGIGNHPAVIRAFVAAGKAIQEGTIHRSDGSEQRTLTDAEKFYGSNYGKKEAA